MTISDAASGRSEEVYSRFMEIMWADSSRFAATTTGTVIFRGQANDWDLSPKLFRDRLLKPKEIVEVEALLLSEFRTRSPYLLPSTPTVELDWLSLAQHHGLPTRLLDWTANPAMALFFAVEQPDPSRPTVWIYYPTNEELENGAKEEERFLGPDNYRRPPL